MCLTHGSHGCILQTNVFFFFRIYGSHGNCELFILCSYSFHFVSLIFLFTQLQFNFQNYFVMQLQFFLPELILQKYSVEGYIDVTRSTYTDLDVMQEKRVDDYWNVDSNRSLSDSWKGFVTRKKD